MNYYNKIKNDKNLKKKKVISKQKLKKNWI